MSSNRTPRTYWQSLDAARGAPDVIARAEREFASELPVGEAQKSLPRRDFFKLMGISTALFAAACGRAPVKKTLPYVNAPEEITPGSSLYYASSCGGCAAGCGVLLKARDGRPIKVEGNPEHPASQGGACAVGQASVLSLYDASRAKGPHAKGKPTTWAAVDERVKAGLAAALASKKAIRVVVPASLGPTSEAAAKLFLDAHPGARLVRHDPLGDALAIAEAHGVTHGARAVPTYRFDRAGLILSVSADFLGTWLSPVAFTRQYSKMRNLRKTDEGARDTNGSIKMARHIQLEPLLSLTGSNADRRFVTAPGDELAILGALIRRVAPRSGQAQAATIIDALAKAPEPSLDAATLDTITNELIAARSAQSGARALVVCGSADPAAQVAAATLNEILGAYGESIELSEASPLDDRTIGFDAFLDELRKGSVGAAIFMSVNPAYDHPLGAEIASLLAKVDFTMSTADRLDETARAAEILAPDHHPYEATDDVAQRRDVIGLRQPVILPLHDTRSAWESLLRPSGVTKSYAELLRERLEREVFPRLASEGLSIEALWDRSLQDGFIKLPALVPAAGDQHNEIERPEGAAPEASAPVDITVPAGAFRAPGIAAAIAAAAARPSANDLSVVLYAKVGLRDGALANNGWLQELPDPISKATWGNYACIAPSLAASLGVRTGSIITVTAGDTTLKLPVLEQPGTHPKAIGVAVGYGRSGAGKIGDGIGENAYRIGRVARGRLDRVSSPARVAVTGVVMPVALAQTHASLEGRSHVREATLDDFIRDPRAGNEEEGGRARSIWSLHAYGSHRWAMSVDLSSCTGCGACVVACQAENNVPIVGKEEVIRGREMSWIRVDRYYAGDPERPSVVHQPMMCQHCENAPCETVCPVLATMHSSEGLNQQVYNRCVGTRYCANNCPTKVRRFNWFDYYGEGPAALFDDPLARLVLNPDVVVRSRGVMEKCSMCSQRIQEGKARARAEGRPPSDGDILTACQQTCPAQAISFGDVNDKNSRVAALAKDERSYKVLGEINVEPAVRYMTRVKNPGRDL